MTLAICAALIKLAHLRFVASELKDPICHSNECQIESFSSEATVYLLTNRDHMTRFKLQGLNDIL